MDLSKGDTVHSDVPRHGSGLDWIDQAGRQVREAAVGKNTKRV
jgi:hypothetical protein